MFGYVIVNKPELKFREFDCYQSWYCGLCRSLKENYGIVGQMTLSYDMTFLILLLTGLYEPETAAGKSRCIAHPFTPHLNRRSEFTDYAADMNILLSWYKRADDWDDEHSPASRVSMAFLQKKKDAVAAKYLRKAEQIGVLMEKIRRCEEDGERNPDLASGYFGEIMAEVFACRRDEWEESLRRMGFFLGKFIYLMDAWEDMDRDARTGNYNVLLMKRREMADETAFAAYADGVLRMMMAECSRAFETLPILENVEILRNILYSGVWCRYEAARRKKESKENA